MSIHRKIAAATLLACASLLGATACDHPADREEAPIAPKAGDLEGDPPGVQGVDVTPEDDTIDVDEYDEGIEGASTPLVPNPADDDAMQPGPGGAIDLGGQPRDTAGPAAGAGGGVGPSERL